MNDLPTTTLGRTGAVVTKLGYGAMELRGPGGTFGRGRALASPARGRSEDERMNVISGGRLAVGASPPAPRRRAKRGAPQRLNEAWRRHTVRADLRSLPRPRQAVRDGISA